MTMSDASHRPARLSAPVGRPAVPRRARFPHQVAPRIGASRPGKGGNRSCITRISSTSSSSTPRTSLQHLPCGAPASSRAVRARTPGSSPTVARPSSPRSPAGPARPPTGSSPSTRTGRSARSPRIARCPRGPRWGRLPRRGGGGMIALAILVAIPVVILTFVAVGAIAGAVLLAAALIAVVAACVVVGMVIGDAIGSIGTRPPSRAERPVLERAVADRTTSCRPPAGRHLPPPADRQPEAAPPPGRRFGASNGPVPGRAAAPFRWRPG